MKQNLIFFILILILVSSNGQSQTITKEDLIGDWQISNPVIASALLHNYTFREDNTFDFNKSEYSFLSRVAGIGGTYYIKNDSLFFHVEYEKQIVGGIPSLDSQTLGGPGWTIYGGEYKKFYLEKPVQDGLWLSPCTNEEERKYEAKCVEFNLYPFYKID